MRSCVRVWAGEQRDVTGARPDAGIPEVVARQPDLDPAEAPIAPAVRRDVPDGVAAADFREDALVRAVEIGARTWEEGFATGLMRDPRERALLEGARRAGLIVEVADRIHDRIALSQQRYEFPERRPAHGISTVAVQDEQ